ncbi:MAG TPA: UDP-N-acetylglucosamine--LPS N-acetylglucosamine transferase [Polyangiaceae bacterium]|nr:UDP-N-acetylglucosamine--LPS N-acetylglucosamine transferase [Polyangiaceae bacterium]
MAKTRKKILAVSSGGGHWIELLRLRPAFDGHFVVFVTVSDAYRAHVGDAPLRVVRDATRWDRLGLLECSMQLTRILAEERPDVVVSTGALPGFFAVLLGKRFGAKTIWVDSLANVEELSMSGQKIGSQADLWLTQWPNLARRGGPEYAGNVLGESL